MPLNPHTLQSLVAVIDFSSYTRAAAHLDRSQPGVYQHVRQLERELGTTLVEQDGKRVVPTDHGRIVYEFAVRLRSSEEDLVRYLADDALLSRGQVRLGAGSTAAEFIVPTVAVAFRKKYPGIDVHVVALANRLAVDEAVASRVVDLGLHSMAAASHGVTKTPLVRDVLVGIAPQWHRLATATEPVTPVQLLSEPMVHFGANALVRGESTAYQTLVDRWFAAGQVTVATPLAVGTLQGMKRAVRDGAGVGIISRFAIDAGDKELATFELAAPPTREFVLVSPSEAWESAVVRAFREFALGRDWLAARGLSELAGGAGTLGP